MHVDKTYKALASLKNSWYFNISSIGAWPNGKAAAFGAEDYRFESYRPSHPT